MSTPCFTTWFHSTHHQGLGFRWVKRIKPVLKPATALARHTFPLIFLWSVAMFSAALTAEAARGRPILNAAKTTFVADNGNLLRGMICGSNPSLIPVITNYGCNAVHLYAESAGNGYSAGAMSNQVDAVVAMTRTNGLYLVLTIGYGGINNSNFIYDFWNFYAKRYANETHVLYEIQNEATSGGPSTAAVRRPSLPC